MAKFSDIPQFLLAEYISILNNLQDDITTENAHLVGDTIVTRGGNLIEFYVDDVNGYKKILLSFNNISNFYFFNKSNQLSYDDTYTEYIESGAYFKIFDATTLESIVIENGQSVYFRKDSLFHDWLIDDADTIFQNRWYSDFLTKNFVNINDIYIYFGNIYGDSTTNVYNINYENFPEFTKRILPEHQRTPRMKEFLNLSFGNIFQEVYNKTKNLPTLIDAMAVDNDLLNYIVEFTNWSFIYKDEYTLAEREFVRDITKLLKMKGTISSIYLLYKVFSNNSNNRLNVYEKWHDSTLTGQISASEYYNFIYLHNYMSSVGDSYLDTGAGLIYYQQFFPSFVWGTDTTNITVHTNSDSWNVNHNLNTYNINYQVYDFNFKRISPKTSMLSNLNTLDLMFDTNISGFCFVKSTAYRKTIDSGYTAVIDTIDGVPLSGSAIDHTFGMMGTSINYDENNYNIHPKIIKLSNGYIETDITDGNIVINEASEKQNSLFSSVWTITHTLGKKGIIVDVYGVGNERIVPDEVQILDDDTIQLTFSESLSGYVLLTEIGTVPLLVNQFSNFDDLILSPHYIVELDLTAEPMSSTTILSEATSENLISYWEKTRPINNVSNYQLVFSPKSDTSGNYHNLYESTSTDAYARSKLIIDPSYFDMSIGDYFISSFIANNDQWIVNHNLNALYLIVQCYDENDEFIKPDSIYYTDSNTVVINFGDIVNGTVLIAISDYHTTDRSIDTIYHRLGGNVIESAVTNTVQVYEPDNVTLTDGNTLTIDNILSNSIVNVKSNTETYHFTNSNIWQISHNTGYKWGISEFYNTNDEQIYPENIKLIDNNTIQVDFPRTITGYAVLYFIPEYVSIYDRLVGSSISISNTQDNAVTYDYKTLISNIKEDNDFVYLTAEIPKEYKYTIREIGVIDSVDNVMFATICSDLVKDNGIKMIIFYKISKGDL